MSIFTRINKLESDLLTLRAHVIAMDAKLKAATPVAKKAPAKKAPAVKKAAK